MSLENATLLTAVLLSTFCKLSFMLSIASVIFELVVSPLNIASVLRLPSVGVPSVNPVPNRLELLSTYAFVATSCALLGSLTFAILLLSTLTTPVPLGDIIISSLLRALIILKPFISRLPPNCGVVSPSKSVLIPLRLEPSPT